MRLAGTGGSYAGVLFCCGVWDVWVDTLDYACVLPYLISRWARSRPHPSTRGRIQSFRSLCSQCFNCYSASKTTLFKRHRLCDYHPRTMHQAVICMSRISRWIFNAGEEVSACMVLLLCYPMVPSRCGPATLLCFSAAEKWSGHLSLIWFPWLITCARKRLYDVSVACHVVDAEYSVLDVGTAAFCVSDLDMAIYP